MYSPSAFVEHDLAVLHDFIEQHSFAMLVSAGSGMPVVSHVPLLLERNAGQGILWGHVARANDQWKEWASGPALAVFTGPHAYISPRWYAEPHTVPTWNYVAVHATGPLTLIEDPTELLPLLARQAAFYESSATEPWTFDPADPFFSRLAQQIVGFRLEIATLSGKWKLSQNHSPTRRHRVITALEQQHSPNSQAIAQLMHQQLP